ncbi:MAG: hypothetical protein ACI8S6_001726 [Myxococcota bacterium]|jgi:hypothetical protein
MKTHAHNISMVTAITSGNTVYVLAVYRDRSPGSDSITITC